MTVYQYIATLQSMCASYGFIDSPLCNLQIIECFERGLTLDEAYSFRPANRDRCNMTRPLVYIAVALAVACAAGGGVPRLYGTGCENRPLGFTLAQEESDFLTRCERIARIGE